MLLLTMLAGAGFSRTIPDYDRRDEALQALSAGGHVLLLRHSSTVGRDHEHVVPADCSTQRNLSDPGRDEARRVGQLLREHGVTLSRIVSSQYCRCMETAAIVGGNAYETQPYLNERKMHVTLVERLIGNFEKDEKLLRPARDTIANWHGTGTMLLVSHAPNIAGLTFEDLAPAEGMVLKPDLDSPLGFTVIGKFKLDR